MASGVTQQFRVFLILGRVSNLPTVWSNCLAGWWLAGGENLSKLPFLFAGVSFLYVGGMFLNDAFDANFDRHFRRERPIPSGAISLGATWRWSSVWLAAGTALLFFAGATTGTLGAALALCIVAYDAVHKILIFSPVLMGACRFFVYMVAATTGEAGIEGEAVWSGIALGSYVTGLSYLARNEIKRGRPDRWPLALLGIPILLALLINAGSNRWLALLLSLMLVLWIARCLRVTFWVNTPNVGRTVTGLLAGIVLVDWLAVIRAPQEIIFTFVALFATTLLMQKWIPAT